MGLHESFSRENDTISSVTFNRFLYLTIRQAILLGHLEVVQSLLWRSQI